MSGDKDPTPVHSATTVVSPTTMVVAGRIVILPHAEEVGLRHGSAPATITSTTGRLNLVVPDRRGEENREAVSYDRSNGCDGTEKCSTTSASTNRPPRQHCSQATSSPEMSAVSAHCRATAMRRDTYEFHDMFGFCVTEAEKAAEDYERRKKGYSGVYLARWQYMLTCWDKVKHDTLKKYCRRGVPQPMRCIVWQHLLRSWGMRERFPGTYMRLRSQPLDSKDIEDVIARDLHRTFPTNRLFREGESGQGLEMLRGILHAYANYNTGVGYCQGMGFLAATLILQVEEEEDAFWAFVALMEDERYNMKGVFSHNFPQLQCAFHVFEVLMRQTMPKLYAHLHDRHHIQPYLYAVHWFMTIFTYYFNFGLVSRIWDMFLCEGWKPVYRIALGLLKLEKQRLLSLNTETELLLALKSIQESKRPVEVLRAALKISFKSDYLKHVVADYNAQPR
ncbi:rab-like GTPase activating protein, putative [Leishmania guyanensis]|uniref:Rab-like GTPase activating protein, putative n=1 Tax=Leishmania guyanensis TaxID=5670 RepID=A0A1E1J8C1_LEIGU|nr:rab-like GTPase activating protein, putative [Leishmania guyanensis]